MFSIILFHLIGEVDAARNLVIMPENHPQLCVAQRKLHQLQDASTYICSDPRLEDEHWHYSLNLMPYTHFTSPIRRYMDIVVHRLVLGAMENFQSPYSSKEVSDICGQMTSAMRRSTRYLYLLKTMEAIWFQLTLYSLTSL
jgi:exoribonuclease R